VLDELLPQLRYHAASLWGRRWTVLIVAWTVSLIGWVIVAALPDRYTAKAQIYVDTQSILGPLMKNLALTPDIDGQVQMMRQTLLSRPNVEKVMEKAELDPGPDDPRRREDRLRQLARQIEVQPVNPALFAVSYSAHDPALAYRVVDAVLDLFVEQNLGQTRRDVDAAQAFIDRQIAAYEAKLRQADLALARFKREHGEELGGVDRAQRELEDARAAKRVLESERISARWQRDQLNLQLASTPRRVAQAEVSQIPTPAEAQLTVLQTQLAQLQLVYTERHPDIVNLKRQIAQAQEQVTRERGEGRGATVLNPVVAQLEEQLRGLDLRIVDLDRRAGLATEDVNRLSILVSESPEAEADLLRLTRDYDALAKSYQELVQRRETASLAKKMDTETRSIEFRVVEPPVVPVQPSGPWRGLLIVAASVVGLGAGLGVALLRVLLRQEIVRPEQLAQSFDVPVIGAIRETRARGAHPFRVVEAAVASLLLVAFLGCSGGLLYRNRVEPVKIDLETSASGWIGWAGRTLGGGSG
jgi:polysaccharide chain length determinant protein (PEP-CTERM system associated)